MSSGEATFSTLRRRPASASAALRPSPLCNLSDLGDPVADLHHRVEMVDRVLKYHRDAVAPEPSHACRGPGSADPALEVDIAGDDAARRVAMSRMIESAVTLLPLPDSPISPRCSPL